MAQSIRSFPPRTGRSFPGTFGPKEWKKRLREAEKAKFVEVQVAPYKEPHHPGTTPERGRTIEIRLVRGCSLVVEPGFDADHLRALLAILEAEG
jgi:hypothetical protein